MTSYSRSVYVPANESWMGGNTAQSAAQVPVQPAFVDAVPCNNIAVLLTAPAPCEMRTIVPV